MLNGHFEGKNQKRLPDIFGCSIWPVEFSGQHPRSGVPLAVSDQIFRTADSYVPENSHFKKIRLCVRNSSC